MSKNFNDCSSLVGLFLIVLFYKIVLQEKVIYHQTMTPTWLEEHAFYIGSSHTKITEQLTFNAGSVSYAALLKVPMIPAGVF